MPGSPPPKVAAADDGFAALAALAQSAAGEVGAEYKTLIMGPWRTFATAVGNSGPSNINRATRAIRAIRGSAR